MCVRLFDGKRLTDLSSPNRKCLHSDTKSGAARVDLRPVVVQSVARHRRAHLDGEHFEPVRDQRRQVRGGHSAGQVPDADDGSSGAEHRGGRLAGLVPDLPAAAAAGQLVAEPAAR